jgi:ABC-type Fe3+ transport system permease subunit
MAHSKKLWGFLEGQLDGWTIGVGLIALLMISPVLVVLSGIFTDSSETWSHLVATVLPQYIQNSLILMLGVGLGVLGGGGKHRLAGQHLPVSGAQLV